MVTFHFIFCYYCYKALKNMKIDIKLEKRGSSFFFHLFSSNTRSPLTALKTIKNKSYSFINKKTLTDSLMIQ